LPNLRSRKKASFLERIFRPHGGPPLSPRSPTSVHLYQGVNNCNMPHRSPYPPQGWPYRKKRGHIIRVLGAHAFGNFHHTLRHSFFRPCNVMCSIVLFHCPEITSVHHICSNRKSSTRCCCTPLVFSADQQNKISGVEKRQKTISKYNGQLIYMERINQSDHTPPKTEMPKNRWHHQLFSFL
jgi:hypothetical protein